MPSSQPPTVAGPATSTTRVSPDNLDSVVLVTDSRSWIAVTVGALAIAVLIAWGVFGTIPARTSVGAVMVRDGAVSHAVAAAPGSVGEVLVNAGETVAAGDDLVTIIATGGGTETVTSSVDGVIQGVGVAVGDEVIAGTRVATVVDNQSSGTLSAVSYVSATEALAFSGVDTVNVSPITVDSGSYGDLEGRVAFISQVPATDDEASAQIGNDALAAELLAQVDGPPYLIVIEFGETPDWTGSGPPFEVLEGTLAELSAITSREAPIDKLLG